MKAIYVSDQIHRRAKLTAARRGVPLKQVVASALERGLREEEGGDVTAEEWHALAARGGAFEFWEDEREDLYAPTDGEPIE